MAATSAAAAQQGKKNNFYFITVPSSCFTQAFQFVHESVGAGLKLYRKREK